MTLAVDVSPGSSPTLDLSSKVKISLTGMNVSVYASMWMTP